MDSRNKESQAHVVDNGSQHEEQTAANNDTTKAILRALQVAAERIELRRQILQAQISNSSSSGVGQGNCLNSYCTIYSDSSSADFSVNVGTISGYLPSIGSVIENRVQNMINIIHGIYDMLDAREIEEQAQRIVAAQSVAGASDQKEHSEP
ncbi:hypothetical protein SUGI_0920310 [Cryptomeria japonica]|nr:hypothetical protein SUGI_0920310 [Cryptomeria japonica]